MTVPTLNDEQCIAILTESLARGIYEPVVPQDPKQRLKDATDIVSLALAASASGNKSDNVETILFIAQTDMKPPAEISTIPQNPPVEEANHIHNGLDLSTITDGILDALIEGLNAYPQNEKVQEDRTAYVAEKERRANAQGSQQNQEIPQGAAQAEAPEKAGEIAPASSASTNEGASQPTASDQGPNTGADAGDGGAGRQIGNTDENAGAFARAQTPETSGEEKAKVSKPKAVEEDGDRAVIEAQLTLPMCKAHGIDLTTIPTIPIEILKFIVENPDGPPKEKKKMIEEETLETVPKDNSSIVGISAQAVAPERAISKADLGVETDGEEDSNGGISAERENLESMVTGPMLKAYGRGRKNIPSIGDNELRFMILNPDGKVSPDDLEKARALDKPISDADEPKDNQYDAEQAQPSQMIVTKEVPGPEIVDHFLLQDDLTEVTLPSGQKVRVKLPNVDDSGQKQKELEDEEAEIKVIKESKDLENDRSIAQAAQQSINVAKQTQVDVPKLSGKELAEQWDNNDETIDSAAEKSQAQSRAMNIIKKENFPIPPDLADDIPVLPMDVSAISRDELFSLHAKFHACESRINWIISGHEDELGDIEKLRRHREAVVAAAVPFIGEDGKRNTNEYRDAQVNADSEVLDYGSQEHEVNKVVKKLKVLQRNYHADCERLSRQMSKYERERLDAPR